MCLDEAHANFHTLDDRFWAFGELLRRDGYIVRFARLVTSGTWTDRNKAAGLLMALTRTRDAETLRKLRAEALDALVEMAKWRSLGHAMTARLVLGRIAGVDESRLPYI